MRSLTLLGAAALACLAAHGPTRAQDFPNKPVTIVVPLAAGGALDVITRSYAQRLAERLGKPVIVENRTGGGTVTAAVAVAKAAADGHTLLNAPSGTLATNATLFKALPYDPAKDFVPIALYAKVPFVLVINPALPAKTLREFIAYTKANPGKVSFASTGTGTVPHLGMEMLKLMAGIEMIHVPYRGTPPALNDVIAGHVQLFFADTAISPPIIQAGKVRALGVSSLTRAGVVPDVPTVAEAGVPGFEAVSWHMLIAPAGTPKPVVDRLHADMRAVMKLPEIEKQMIEMGLIPIDSPSVDELHRFVESEIVRWGDIVRKVGIAGTE
jgi:tripartite-type tricarboxylate transporter receptor subunit TctC